MSSQKKLTINISTETIMFGTSLAMILSYAKWQSILWAIFHGLLSWLYVAYYIIEYGIN